MHNNVPVSKSIGGISTDERIRLIHEAYGLGVKAVIVAGEGEPSISEGIRQIIPEVNSHGMIPIIYSNGSLLSKKMVNFYKQNNTVIIISLDSLQSEKYDRLTGTKGQLDIVLKNIKNLRKAYSDAITAHGNMKIMSLAINSTVSSKNEEEIAAIKEFCGDDMYFICNPLARLGNAAGNWNDMISDAESVSRQKALIERLSETGGPLALGSDGFCGYSRWGIGVSPFGDYMTCAYTVMTDGLLGNVRNSGLKEAFEHKHKKEARYYETYGIAPCLIRSKNYSKYIEQLKKELK